MLTAILIPRISYEEILDSVESLAKKEDRSAAKMAAILIQEALMKRSEDGQTTER